MANAGFNAATDIFAMGASFKVKSAKLNASASVAECPDNNGDITHRDSFAVRIAPTAEYELAADVTSLPAIGTVVTIESKAVAISSIAVSTSAGAAPTVTVTGTQIEDGAATGRTYACGTVALTTRHRAQDILGLLGETVPSTLTQANFTFTADVTPSEPKGEIVASDVSNGKVQAAYTHTSGDAAVIAAPAVTGTDAVVSQPVTKDEPENNYVTMAYTVTKSLTGTDAA